MDQENCAQEAPRGSFTRAPTGFRRLTPGLLKADRTAEKFTGLPEGVTSHGQLLAALKAASSRLSIAPRVVHALDWLFWERQGKAAHADKSSLDFEGLSSFSDQLRDAILIQYMARVAIEQTWS